MNINNIKIRCSSLGSIMTEPRSKSETLSETCKTHLIDVFIEKQYGRSRDISSKYMEKGTLVEADSITLYSRVKRVFFKKNETRLYNEFITGEPDLYIGESVTEADEVLDLKSSWDLWTYWKARMSDVNKSYFWQLQGYAALTGAKRARLVYCLVDTPDHIIEDEKWKLARRMGVIDSMHNPEYIEACKSIDLNSKFGDIPLVDRCHEIQIERDEKAITAIYERVQECRQWLKDTFYPGEVLTEQLEKSIAV